MSSICYNLFGDIMNLTKKLEKYLKENLELEKHTLLKRASYQGMALSESCESASISNYINDNKEDSFQKKLFELIDNRELKDSDVYNKVNIDRRLFSKIRSNEEYHPSKETVILLGIGLELDESEIEELLESASYSLPKNTTYDLIIRFCFKEHIYDINTINEFLYNHNCKTLN